MTNIQIPDDKINQVIGTLEEHLSQAQKDENEELALTCETLLTAIYAAKKAA